MAGSVRLANEAKGNQGTFSFDRVEGIAFER